MKEYDIVVVGAGPAGSAAAIYAKRYGMNVVVFESGAIGGQLSWATEIENYPGFSKISGMDYAESIRKHLEHLNIPVEIDTVKSVKKSDKWFEVELSSGVMVRSLGLILATGSSHRHLGIPGEEAFTGRGVSYCATCDGYFFKGRTVAVIGGGNTALTYALYLESIASKVYLVHRRNEFRAEKAVVDKVLSSNKIELQLGYTPVSFEGDTVLRRIRLKGTSGSDERVLDVDGVFIAVGEDPNNTLAKQLGIPISEKGFVQVDDKQATTVPGVYVAGDLTGKGWAQAINAAAQGMTAGIECSIYVQGLKSKE
ncbi:MAG: FAD-dependent oxidoreductase [Candidatus Micrarchaeia archaeon]